MGIVDFGSSIASQTEQVAEQARLSLTNKLSQVTSSLNPLSSAASSLTSLGSSPINTMTISAGASNAASSTSSLGNSQATAPPFNGVNANQAANSNQPGSGKTSFTPIPNALNAFDQATYSIRFSLVSDQSNNNAEIVIAESGKTDINISSLTITSLQAPSAANRSAPAATMELKLFEPMGSNLPDKLIIAAQNLSSNNYMKGPWKITVKFKGYNPQTGQPNTSILSRDWSWTVVLTEMKSRINESGSNHTLTFVPMNQVGLFDQFVKPTETFSVPIVAGQTVGSILNSIIARMNTIVMANYASPYVEYSIDQIPYKHPVGGVANPFDNKINSSNPLLQPERSGMVTISGGSSLMAVIDNLFAASPTACTMANAASRDPNNNPNTYLDVVSTFHSVESQVTLGSYNDKVQDYNRKIKYIIHPYETVSLITNNEQQQQINDPVKNQEKANFIVSNKYVSKIYDYIFTGQNTEVLKFDIDLNFMWSMVTDNDFGARHYDSITVAKAANSVAITQANSSTSTDMQGGQAATNFNGSPPPASGSAASTNTIAPQSAAPNNGTPARQTTNAKAQTTQTNISYVDDLNYKPKSNFNKNPVTLSPQGSTNRTQTTSFVESDFTKQRSVYGMLLNQLYKGGSMEYNMISIKLDIRGDPYWLGQDQSDAVGTPSTSSANQTPTSAYPAFLNGQYIFILRFNLPEGYNESTGTVNIVQSQMYTGFYNCVQVDHTFKDGAYTQTLTGTRVLGMDLNNLLNVINGS